MDAQADFGRARRRRALARLAARLRREPDDIDLMLPFEEVVAALGRVGQRPLGLELIAVDSIVGSVNRPGDFDRAFRPTNARVRERWERIAAAIRRGESMPPIDVYRIGDLHFVQDGHHRVSVARAHGMRTIEARVTEVITSVAPPPGMRPADLPLKSHERLFAERVPLPPSARRRIQLSDEWRYAGLAEGVEAWGFRLMQDRGCFMTREEVADAWFREDYVPVVALLREAGLAGPGTETEAYMRIVALRYMLLRTHGWDDQIVENLRGALEAGKPTEEEDTLVHQLRREAGSPQPRQPRDTPPQAPQAGA
jgi:hypothetical protein